MDVENISVAKLLLKMSPPVMLALLIQSIYNIADSFFVAKYSAEGLSALSIVYPIQLLITALERGTGSVVNIVLDVILIFGAGRIPALGITGAAAATVIGQWAAMTITLLAVMKKYSLRGTFKQEACKQIYANGMGSIITQSLYTIYIIGLNMILKIFTEDAVTVLGIYYKIQSFFFIPLLGFQQVLLPLFSYHYGAGNNRRNREILKYSMLFSVSIMATAIGIFFLFSEKLIQIFSAQPVIVSIGKYAFPVIPISFIFAGLTIVITSYLQGIAHIKASLFIIVLRQIILLVPLAWIFHYIGLDAVWWTFPVTEIIASMTGILIIVILHKKLQEISEKYEVALAQLEKLANKIETRK